MHETRKAPTSTDRRWSFGLHGDSLFMMKNIGKGKRFRPVTQELEELLPNYTVHVQCQVGEQVNDVVRCIIDGPRFHFLLV